MSFVEYIGEAPGRLDLLGGVADYSGSLVLEIPIQGHTRVTVRDQEVDKLHFESQQADAAFELPLGSIKTCLELTTPERRCWLDERKVPSHVRYLFGCLLLMAETQQCLPENGLHLSVESTVPIAMGVSSSAALEVACLKALQQRFRLSFNGTELAKLAQRVENEIVGAPCGLMDQLTCAYGEPGSLLPILCRPDLLQDPIPLPPGVCVIGWASGVEHAVGGSPYATTRCATFMGLELLKHITGKDWQYPTEITPEVFESICDQIPESMTGRDFLHEHECVSDPLSVVEPDTGYGIRDSLRFPIEEHHRATRCSELLRSKPDNDETLCAVGEAMYASHEGYTRIGLGHPATDEMVALVRSLGPEKGFYGARVSGGGCGGTVAILMRQSALDLFESTRRAREDVSWSQTQLILSSKTN
ncbi:MAG: galactokinase [Puniceicoccaceae bacterium]